MDKALFSANPKKVTECLFSKRILIVGCGGLGSNVAMLLVRAGIHHITLMDFDVISSSNLNRQFFFADQVGQLKTSALSQNLLRINPSIQIHTISEKLSKDNIKTILPLTEVDFVLECLDTPETKIMLVLHVLKNYPHLPIIAVSGLAGISPISLMCEKKGPGHLIMIGDQVSEVLTDGTVSSRVMAASALQAHAVIRLACGE